jgi:UDP-N-acetylmuramate: L-alanyl-gamma-D-glutamyl-meso-diaminopimelate ligase
LDWDASDALSAMGSRAMVNATVDGLVAQITSAARPGDHVVCMSNGGFGGIHGKLLQALA